jgi:CheY-like chemotaxis protein
MPRILLVDDDPHVRKILRLLLENAGHEVEEATNGAEALHACLRQSSDLIFCELFMPGKEGLTTIRELSVDFPDTKIVAMSGAGSNMLHLAYRLGAHRVLPKPFRREDDLLVVQQALAYPPRTTCATARTWKSLPGTSLPSPTSETDTTGQNDYRATAESGKWGTERTVPFLMPGGTEPFAP